MKRNARKSFPRFFYKSFIINLPTKRAINLLVITLRDNIKKRLRADKIARQPRVVSSESKTVSIANAVPTALSSDLAEI